MLFVLEAAIEELYAVGCEISPLYPCPHWFFGMTQPDRRLFPAL
jgi:hypothetical protein